MRNLRKSSGEIEVKRRPASRQMVGGLDFSALDEELEEGEEEEVKELDPVLLGEEVVDDEEEDEEEEEEEEEEDEEEVEEWEVEEAGEREDTCTRDDGSRWKLFWVEVDDNLVVKQPIKMHNLDFEGVGLCCWC